MRLARTFRSSVEHAADSLESPQHLRTVVHLLEHGGERTLHGSAQWALQHLAELTHSDNAFLFVPQGERVQCLARIGVAEPNEEIHRFVAAALAAVRMGDDDEGEDRTVATAALLDVSRVEALGQTFQLSLLRRPAQPANDNHEVIGAVVVSGRGVAPASVLQAIGARLAASQ